jgi:hypothetical protein
MYQKNNTFIEPNYCINFILFLKKLNENDGNKAYKGYFFMDYE